MILWVLVKVLWWELKWSNIRIIGGYLLGIVISDWWLELRLVSELLWLLDNNALSGIEGLNELRLLLVDLLLLLLLGNNLLGLLLKSLCILERWLLILGRLIDRLLLEVRGESLECLLLSLVLERLLLIGKFLRNFLILENLLFGYLRWKFSLV